MSCVIKLLSKIIYRKYVFGVRSDLHAMHMLGQLCLSMLLVWTVSDVVSPLY